MAEILTLGQIEYLKEVDAKGVKEHGSKHCKGKHDIMSSIKRELKKKQGRGRDHRALKNLKDVL